MAERSVEYDVIIIGGGHNGLTCAAYLAAAGLKVKILEKREVIGGAALTEEFHPGFRNSVYSYSVSLLNPKVIQDLELARHGLTILERPSGTLSLLENDHLLLSRNEQQARQEIARFSRKDAELVDEFHAQLDRVARAMRQIAMATPPEFGGGWGDLVSLAKAGNTFRKLDSKDQIVLVELMTKSLGDYLDSWFESDALKGVYGLEGAIGHFADPYQPGTAYLMLHYAFGEVNGKSGAWGIARGGMGAITSAMKSCALERGVDIDIATGVREIMIQNDTAIGVVTEQGKEVTARAVAANVHPQTLLLNMLDPKLLDEQTRRRVTHHKNHSATFRMNVALSELPRFTSLPGDEDAHFKGAIELSPSLDYLSAAYSDAKRDGWSRQPVISMQVPSTQDDSLCPEGNHVASLFCQHFQRHLPDNQSWDDLKAQVADEIIDTVDHYAPNFKRSVLGRQIKSPLDIERDLGMVGGDIFHGALQLDQLYSMRPVPGYAGYRMPVNNLYLCGSGAHPGGGVSGLPGHHAAHKMLQDRHGWS